MKILGTLVLTAPTRGKSPLAVAAVRCLSCHLYGSIDQGSIATPVAGLEKSRGLRNV